MSTMAQRGMSKLPLEIRQAIWTECLPDPTSSPEIYFYNRGDFGPEPLPASDDGTGREARLKVVIQYPVILHVCHESRHFALKSHRISFQWFQRQVTPLRGQPSFTHKLMPCRPYLPETDIFLITETDISDLWDEADRRRNDPNSVFRSIQHLALGSWHLMDEHTIEFWIDFMLTLPSLRRTLVIFGNYWGFNASSSCIGDEFRQFRHFSLVPFTEETAVLHPEFSEEMLDDLELAPVKVANLMFGLNYLLAAELPHDVDLPTRDDTPERRLVDFDAVKMVTAPPESNCYVGGGTLQHTG